MGLLIFILAIVGFLLLLVIMDLIFSPDKDLKRKWALKFGSATDARLPIAFYLLPRSMDKALIRRHLKRASRFSVDQFPEDTVGKLVGWLVRIDEPLVAPLTGRLCVYYRLTIKEYKYFRRHSIVRGYWKSFDEKEVSQTFFLQDATAPSSMISQPPGPP